MVVMVGSQWPYAISACLAVSIPARIETALLRGGWLAHGRVAPHALHLAGGLVAGVTINGVFRVLASVRPVMLIRQCGWKKARRPGLENRPPGRGAGQSYKPGRFDWFSPPSACFRLRTFGPCEIR